MNIQEAAQALRNRKLSSEELTRSCLQRIEALNGKLNAFMTVTTERALADARRADAELAAGHDRGPLHGIPIAHKDLFCTKDIRTTAGAKIWTDYIPNFDAAVVERLHDAGAVLLGKTGMHEHAYGITSNNPHFGAIRNPWNPEHIPGGSSGGSAVAVSTGMAMLATGSDTGGSIRCPASYCGVVGLKPTFGLVSKYGAMPLGFSLDHVGPLTLTVRDAAIALEAMAGHDLRDPNSAKTEKTSYVPAADLSLKDVRILLPQNFFFEGVSGEVRQLVLSAAQVAEGRGATFVMGRVPDGAQLNTVAQVTLLSEAAAVHEPYIRKRRADYGLDVAANIDMGRMISATDFIQAQRMRRRILNVFLELFKKADCLFVPATPTAAPAIGATEVSIDGKMEETRSASTRLLRGINALGLPSLAVPCGVTAEGLPIACQLIGKPFSEAKLLQIGAALEDSLGLAPLQPKL